jgi:hypothetical protein
MAEQPEVKNKSKQRVAMTLKFVLIVILLAAIIKLFFFSSGRGYSDNETKHKEAAVTIENFAKCLNEKGLVMYGIDTCEFCQAQKKMFGAAFEKINYVNCDFDKDKCAAEGVTGYPMWTLGERKINGIQIFEKLSVLTGCTAPVESFASQ